MAYDLTADEIRLLKELKGAGSRGRLFSQASLVLARLMRAGYVKRRVTEVSADRYEITDLGAEALSDAMA
jgi:hypothetical protein